MSEQPIPSMLLTRVENALDDWDRLALPTIDALIRALHRHGVRLEPTESDEASQQETTGGDGLWGEEP